MSKLVHLHVDIRSALENWSPGMWRKGCRDPETGRKLTPTEVRSRLLDAYGQGVRVIPVGEACEGFDYGGKGCPGHPIQED